MTKSEIAAPTPNSDHKNSLHKICSKGWVARAPFFIGNAARLSEGWARWDANLVMQTCRIIRGHRRFLLFEPGTVTGAYLVCAWQVTASTGAYVYHGKQRVPVLPTCHSGSGRRGYPRGNLVLLYFPPYPPYV